MRFYKILILVWAASNVLFLLITTSSVFADDNLAKICMVPIYKTSKPNNASADYFKNILPRTKYPLLYGWPLGQGAAFHFFRAGVLSERENNPFPINIIWDTYMNEPSGRIIGADNSGKFYVQDEKTGDFIPYITEVGGSNGGSYDLGAAMQGYFGISVNSLNQNNNTQTTANRLGHSTPYETDKNKVTGYRIYPTWITYLGGTVIPSAKGLFLFKDNDLEPLMVNGLNSADVAIRIFDLPNEKGAVVATKDGKLFFIHAGQPAQEIRGISIGSYVITGSGVFMNLINHHRLRIIMSRVFGQNFVNSSQKMIQPCNSQRPRLQNVFS